MNASQLLQINRAHQAPPSRTSLRLEASNCDPRIASILLAKSGAFEEKRMDFVCGLRLCVSLGARMDPLPQYQRRLHHALYTIQLAMPSSPLMIAMDVYNVIIRLWYVHEDGYDHCTESQFDVRSGINSIMASCDEFNGIRFDYSWHSME
eukprot:604069_1